MPASAALSTLKAISRPANQASIAFHRSLGMAATEAADYSGEGHARLIFWRDLHAPGTELPPRPAGAEHRETVLAIHGLYHQPGGPKLAAKLVRGARAAEVVAGQQQPLTPAAVERKVLPIRRAPGRRQRAISARASWGRETQ